MSHTLLDLKRAEDAGEICAMEDASQSVMCLHEPLHAGRHSWQPYPADEVATPYTEQETTKVEERPDDDPAPVATCNGRDCGGRPHE